MDTLFRLRGIWYVCLVECAWFVSSHTLADAIHLLYWPRFSKRGASPDVSFWTLINMRNQILVTGGAGFIGSNFILQWINQESSPILNLDKHTYAGNPQN